MFVIQMQNSADEWELCRYVFKSYAQAEAFYNANLTAFDNYVIEELQAY